MTIGLFLLKIQQCDEQTDGVKAIAITALNRAKNKSYKKFLKIFPLGYLIDDLT